MADAHAGMVAAVEKCATKVDGTTAWLNVVPADDAKMR